MSPHRNDEFGYTFRFVEKLGDLMLKTLMGTYNLMTWPFRRIIG